MMRFHGFDSYKSIDSASTKQIEKWCFYTIIKVMTKKNFICSILCHRIQKRLIPSFSKIIFCCFWCFWPGNNFQWCSFKSLFNRLCLFDTFWSYTVIEMNKNQIFDIIFLINKKIIKWTTEKHAIWTSRNSYSYNIVFGNMLRKNLLKRRKNFVVIFLMNNISCVFHRQTIENSR